jgi:Putative adhesin
MYVTGGRLAALAVGLPFVVGAAACGAFSVVGDMAQTSERHVASYPWNGGAITLRTDGNVTVEVGSGPQIAVTYTEHYQLKKPSVTSATSDGGLQLTAKCPGAVVVFGSNCAINYVLTVPAAAMLDLHSGDGDIHVNGSTAALSLDTGDGDIEFDNVSGNVVAQSGDGGISGSQVSSKNFQATTGDGGIHVTWSVTPATVVATTGDGGIHLVVPQGSGPYRTSTHTGDGSAHVSVATDPTASPSITAESGDGSITIGYPAS